VSLYAAPDFLLGWALARSRGARTALWIEVTYDALVARRHWKEALKSKVFSRADAVLTAGSDGHAFAQRYGARGDRIFHVPHVIDAARYFKGSDLSPSERARIRADLGLRGITFVYVGRFLLGKGLVFLLDAFAALQQSDVEQTSLLLVGDGPDEALLRDACRTKSLENVVFTGFQDADTVQQLYGSSDVFVFPTLGDTFGLVVSEAMACGLPVISTSAVGEIRDRVIDGVNGFIVTPANVEQLLTRMTLLARDFELRQRMGKASAEKVAWQRPEDWAEAFERAVERILSMPRLKDSRPRHKANTDAARGRRTR
jgi:glycosyltransferase involved in cell wall biosynthesis